MSFTRHPLWSELAPYFRIERCAGDGWRKPRVRLEVKRLPPELLTKALTATMGCVACGAEISPIRQRHAPPGRGPENVSLYFACCCALAVRVGCSRGTAAHTEYERIAAALTAWEHAA